jgi:hypothetical protein
VDVFRHANHRAPSLLAGLPKESNPLTDRVLSRPGPAGDRFRDDRDVRCSDSVGVDETATAEEREIERAKEVRSWNICPLGLRRMG